jgi:Mg2+/citrate symporter
LRSIVVSAYSLALSRPQNFWINILLTLVVLVTMAAFGEKLAQISDDPFIIAPIR